MDKGYRGTHTQKQETIDGKRLSFIPALSSIAFFRRSQTLVSCLLYPSFLYEFSCLKNPGNLGHGNLFSKTKAHGKDEHVWGGVGGRRTYVGSYQALIFMVFPGWCSVRLKPGSYAAAYSQKMIFVYEVSRNSLIHELYRLSTSF